ncbi:MAG: 3-hydroxyacyl-CoA dehydrogenase/enoyl-CoA hydratase family protein [Planctomycetes bacterium]|nr:3-hydroxyacyl-CoA dehydrogenase/enoyl-CoA hydratase family protein [Planctomycetota bacterium]
MAPPSIRKIGVIGSGQIGPDIALYFSKVFHDRKVPVVVVDIRKEALDAGCEKTKKKLAKGVESGAFRQNEVDSMLANLSWTTDYGALAGADLVVEAATEDLNIKRRIFETLERSCPPTAILASNSSHLEPEVIFEKAQDPSRCLVIHYFFPAERNIIVEVVPGRNTSKATSETCMKLYESIGKVPLKVGSRYGYAIDPVFEGLFLGAARLAEQGAASTKQIDAIARSVLGLGVGPFTAMNLTGGNPITAIGLKHYHEKIGPWFGVPKILEARLAEGKPWDVPGRGENVTWTEDQMRAVSDALRGCFFGLVTEILDAGVAGTGDLELGVETALAMNAPFAMMNALGVPAALELVQAYAAKNPGFKVPGVLKKQAASGKPWEIPVVLREDREGVAVLTFRRPKVLNALNGDVMKQLSAHLEAVRADAKVRGIVLTGYGSKAFVSGADINELAALKTPQQATGHALSWQQVANAVEDFGKPVVCAYNGLAFGGGNELAMACHARVARKGLAVLFAQPEVRLGIIPGMGGTQRLPRIVGLFNAWAPLRTGAPVSGARAKEWGLLLEECEDPLARAVEIVNEAASGKRKLEPIARGPIDVPAGLPETDLGHLSRKIDEMLRRAITEGAAKPLEEGLKHEARLFGDCLKTEDMRVGMENFLKNGPKANAAFVHR